jgi:anaerobic magnesium-protoporphyrin IX monomethyl ester cyclase
LTLHRLDVSGAQRGLLMGLAYLAASLRQAGHTPLILNCRGADDAGTPISSDFRRYGLPDQEIIRRIAEFNPDLVGISCMFTSYFMDAHRLAALVKQWNPRIPVIFGGAHASTFPECVLKDENVDLVVIGEGEVTFCEVVNRIAAQQNLGGVEGIAHRIAGQVVREKSRDFIENLDLIPFPAWDLTDDDIQWSIQNNRHNPFLMRPPVGHLLTSRGCPNDCYFCSVKLTWSRCWRARSAKNVVDEIEFLKNKYSYREFHFVDDNSSVSKKRLIEICDEILARHLDIKIATPTGIAIATLDKEVLSKMKQAGFYRLCFGLETGDPEGQKIIKKRVNLEKARTVIKIANQLGFWTSATFILGFPHETRAHIQKTIDFARSSQMDFVIFYLLTPQPGTEVYQLLKADGLIDLDPYLDPHNPDCYKISLTYCNGFKNRHLSNAELQAIVAQAYRSFLIGKLFSLMSYINLCRKMRSWEDARYLFHLAAIPLRMLTWTLLGKRLSNTSIRSKHHADYALKKVEDV